MSIVQTPRCGERIRNWKTCGRPAGHSGGHLSREAYRRSLDDSAARRAKGLNTVATHGYGGYSVGCRCDECKAAKAAYMRERRAAAYVADSAPEADPAVTHGTRFAYEERGCRCDKCMAAVRASSRWNRPRKGRAA